MYWQIVVLALAASLQASGASENCTSFGTLKEPVSPRCEDDWIQNHSKLAEEVQRADQHQGWRIIFYGDSIFETLRGIEKPWPTQEIHHIWRRHYMGSGKTKLSGVLAIGGDHTGHLLWRLENGHLLKRWAPRACVVLIGTNDLFGLLSPHNEASEDAKPDLQDAADHVYSRIRSVVDVLAEGYPGTTILVMGLLPRGAPTWEQMLDTSTLSDDDFRLPNKYSDPIRDINDKLADWVHDIHARSHGMYRNATVHYVGCSGPFMEEDRHHLSREMMPDAIHPSAKGMQALVRCLESHLQPIVSGAAGPMDLTWRQHQHKPTDGQDEEEEPGIHLGAHEEL